MRQSLRERLQPHQAPGHSVACKEAQEVSGLPGLLGWFRIVSFHLIDTLTVKYHHFGLLGSLNNAGSLSYVNTSTYVTYTTFTTLAN